jgi:hypothetical protein
LTTWTTIQRSEFARSNLPTCTWGRPGLGWLLPHHKAGPQHHLHHLQEQQLLLLLWLFQQQQVLLLLACLGEDPWPVEPLLLLPLLLLLLPYAVQQECQHQLVVRLRLLLSLLLSCVLQVPLVLLCQQQQQPLLLCWTAGACHLHCYRPCHPLLLLLLLLLLWRLLWCHRPCPRLLQQRCVYPLLLFPQLQQHLPGASSLLCPAVIGVQGGQ